MMTLQSGNAFNSAVSPRSCASEYNYNRGFNFGSSSKEEEGVPAEQNYSVHEPSSLKRTADMRELDGAPRAKRRFERMSSKLERFKINGDDEPTHSDSPSSSSDDDEMGDSEMNGDQTIVVEEPDDEPVKWKRIRLDENLQRYLQMAKEGRNDLWPKFNQLQGNELTLWRPHQNPFDDLKMTGRIQELSDSDAISAHFLLSGTPPIVSYPDSEGEEKESQSGSSTSDEGGAPSPPPSSPTTLTSVQEIVEIEEQSPSPISSLMNTESEDDEMDFE